jgi:cell division GTPase FtsZ
MSKPRQSLYFILIALGSLYVFSLFIETEVTPCEARKQYLASEMEGKVKQKYIKQPLKSFRKDTLVVLENGTTVPSHYLSFYKEFYNTVSINDLIIKKRDSDSLLLYRNNRLLKAYRPTFDCPENQ